MGKFNSSYSGADIDSAVKAVLDGTLQNKLIAGDGIKIEGPVISNDIDHTIYATKEEVSSTYATKVSVEQGLSGKQDVIPDLDSIRSGASKGSTAIQEHQDISHLLPKTDFENYATKTDEQLNELAHKGEVRHIERDLGMYPELEPLPLNSEVTGKYINSDGKYVDASDWSIASIGAVSLGNTYLLNMVSSANMVLGVALFVSRVYKRDKEGKIIGTTLTPLFSAKNTSIPASGYVLFEAMDDYEEVLICYKPALTTQMLVARWGFKASHATQLRNLRLVVDNKTDFEGIYELLTAGYALNLVGKGNGEPQAFMSRKTGGGNITDGSAVIKEVDGVKPIVWNQLVKNLNFAPEVMGITRAPGQHPNSVHYSGTSTSTTNFTATGAGFKYDSNHVMLFGLVNMPSTCGLSVAANFGTAYTVVKNFSTASFGMTIPEGVSVDVDVIPITIDLTLMFGAGNEPSTYEEYLNRISRYYIKDAYAYNAGEVVNYKGVGIKTTNIDGTKTYIRDWSEVMKKYFPDGMTSLNGVKDFFNDKKAVRKWGCKVFDGTEGWTYRTADATPHFDIKIVGQKATGSYSTLASMVASNYNNAIWSEIFSKVGKYGYICQGDNTIGISDSSYTNIDSWKAHLADLYAQGNPLVVYYELSEPVEDIFDKLLNLTYTVINGGTETSLATENSTQFEGSIFYGKDYVGVIDELQLQNRVTQIEFENWEN